MFEKMFENASKPKDNKFGKMMLSLMNIGHKPIANWGMKHLEFVDVRRILDIGCGGGANIKRMHQLDPQAHIYGVDYSLASVVKSREVNNQAINDGLVEIQEASVSKLPFEQDTFDLVTAFETIYFWPNLIMDFKEVYRVLKPGACFFICNESSDPKSGEFWTDRVNNMTIYTESQLKDLLLSVGYRKIISDVDAKKTRIAVKAYK